MPANLPAEARAKWIKVMEAKSAREKIKALEDFLSSVPKHKGTEKLISQVRRQIATLRRELELERKKRKGKGPKFFIEKEGDAQIVILGFTKCGKSSLLKKLTNANVKISDSPFETKQPVPGMMVFKGVYFQLVEAPAIIEGASSGLGWGLQTLALARNADGLILLIDATQDINYQYRVLIEELEKARISIKKKQVLVNVERRSHGGIIVVGQLKGCSLRDVEKLLKSYNIHHALVRVEGEATLSDIEDSLFENVVYKPALVIINKIDSLSDMSEVESFEQKLLSEDIPCIKVSIQNNFNSSPDVIGAQLFKLLNLIRVYTKKPRSKEISKRPLVVKKGITVIEVAKIIHSRLYKNFRYARVWSPRLKFSPQKVGADFVLEDGDVLEIISS